jgi:hypothetical protein
MQKRPSPRRIGSRVIVTTNLTQNAVTNVELAPDSVTAETLAPNSVTADAIEPGSITSTELAEDAGGANTTFTPTAPANPVLGDLWFDSSDNVTLKRWSGTAWVSMRDLGIAAAAAGAAAASTAATAAQTTADGKNKVYRQTAEPTGGTYAEGDLWFDTDDNNKIYRRTGTAWTAVQLGGEALANINANKITAGSIDASVITVSNLDAGNITTGTIAASRITSTSISAANITAAQITSGEISSARITTASISAASINADNITAGTITGRAIAGGTVTTGTWSAAGSTGLKLDSAGYITGSGGGVNIRSYGTDGTDGATGTRLFGDVIFTPRMEPNNFSCYDGTNSTTINNNGTVVITSSNPADGNLDLSRNYGAGANFIRFVNRTTGNAITAIEFISTTRADFNHNSDMRLKEDIVDMRNSLDIVNRIRPVHYRMKAGLPEEYEDGFLAQELHEVYPLAVSRGLDDVDENDNLVKPWGVYYGTFAPLLTSAIQELSAKVDLLEARIQTLEGA